MRGLGSPNSRSSIPVPSKYSAEAVKAETITTAKWLICQRPSRRNSRYASAEAGSTVPISRQPPPASTATEAQARATMIPLNHAGYSGSAWSIRSSWRSSSVAVIRSGISLLSFCSIAIR